MRDDRAGQPGRYYHLGNLRFERHRNGRWRVGDGMLGVTNFRTPLGALLGLRKWRREFGKTPPQDPS
jgi:hypothetical protein